MPDGAAPAAAPTAADLPAASVVSFPSHNNTTFLTEPEELVRDILWTVNKEGMTATELCGTCQKDPHMGSLVANVGVILVDQGLQMLEQSTTEDSDNIWGHLKTQLQFLENILKVLEFENIATRELLIDVSADMRIRQGVSSVTFLFVHCVKFGQQANIDADANDLHQIERDEGGTGA